jgi:hypothetical protein
MTSYVTVLAGLLKIYENKMEERPVVARGYEKKKDQHL